MKNILALAFVIVSAASYAVTYSYSGPTVGIPDANPSGVSISINGVPSLSVINSVSITATHSWAGDLIATLTNDTSAQTVILFSRPSYLGSGFGDSSDLAGTYTFQAVGADFVAAAAGTTAPIPVGAYRSSNGSATINTDLGANGFFAGAQAAGNWTLKVTDNGGGDTGSISAFSIEGSPVPEPTTMAALGLGLAAIARRRRNKK